MDLKSIKIGGHNVPLNQIVDVIERVSFNLYNRDEGGVWEDVFGTNHGKRFSGLVVTIITLNPEYVITLYHHEAAAFMVAYNQNVEIVYANVDAFAANDEIEMWESLNRGN